MPWAALLGFIRIATNARMFDNPHTVAQALAIVSRLLDHDSVWIPEPTARHLSTLHRLLAAVPSGGNTVPDAHLAALAIEHDLTIATADAGFARFPGLRWFNPLDRAAGG